MTRSFAFGLLAACLIAGAGFTGSRPAVAAQEAAAAAQEGPVFRVGSDLVRAFVTVTDRDGRLVPSLRQADFEVRDEGKPQPITVFDNTPTPIQLIVMLDVSGSMEGNLPLLRNAARQLVSRLQEDDVARVGTFGKEITISPEFTRDPATLVGALPQDIDRDALTPLWRAVSQAMAGFDEKADRRKVVLVLSDGKDSGMTSFRERMVSPAEVIDKARAGEVMVYAIGLRSRTNRTVQPGLGPGGLQAALTADLPDPGLARVAEETGGGYTEIRYGQDLGEAFAQVADELHSQYLLGFEPPKRDGKVHKIEVKVAQSGMKPRARRTYVAPKD
jgi:VWFA-related protein